MKKFILALSLILLLCGIANAMETIEMSVQEVIIQPAEETKIYTNNWSNDKLSIQIRLTWIGCLIRITNNTDQPMLLIWNKSAMVDIDGNSHRLVPGETRKIDSARSIPETMIPPHTSYPAMAVAVGYYFDNTAQYKFMLNYPCEIGFFGRLNFISNKKSKRYIKFAQKHVGRTLSMILCLNINDQDEYYNFNMALDFYKKIDEVAVSSDGTIDSPTVIPIGWELDGAKLKNINEGQAADKAGLTINDLILEINGRTFSEIDQPQQLIESRFSAGRTVMLLIDRDGDQKMITLKKD